MAFEDSVNEIVLSLPETPYSMRGVVTTSGLGLRLLEAQLQLNVARFGSMSVFA